MQKFNRLFKYQIVYFCILYVLCSLEMKVCLYTRINNRENINMD